jgi:Ca2+-binding RTX toxin-like protein
MTLLRRTIRQALTNRSLSRTSRRRRFRSAVGSAAVTELLEERELLTVITSQETIVADNVSQFAPGAPGKIGFDKFLGAEFNTGTATIGDFFLGTGVQAKFGLHGKVGFQVGAFVNPGSINAISDVQLQTDVPDEVMLGDVTIGTVFDTASEAFETASPSLGGYADLVAEIGGIAQLEWSVLGFGDTIGGPFGLDLGQELFAINRDDDRQFRLMGERAEIGGSIEKETSKNPPTSLKMNYGRLDEDRDDAFKATVWSVLGDDTKGPTLEKRLGEMTVAAPKIYLGDGTADANGRLVDSGESDLATLKFDVSPIIGQALGIGAGLGTTAIDFGIGRAEITTVKLDVGPELALQQSAEVTPHSMLTYDFTNEVEVTLKNLATGVDRMPTDNVGDPNKVTSVTFDPNVEQFSVNFTGQPINVTPTWDYSLELHNDIDLAVQLGGRLEVGKLDMSVDFPWPVGTQSFTLGPLFSLPFQQNLGAFDVFDDTFTIAQESVQLAPFTIGEGYMLPADALVVSTHDDIEWTEANPEISLRQAILNANEKDRQESLSGQNSEQNVIYLDSGEYLLTDVTGSSAGDLDITDRDLKIVGTGNTIIDAGALGDRIFDVEAGAGLTLEGVTLRNGSTTTDGGAIRNRGTTEVISSYIVNNSAGRHGGAIYNDRNATFTMTGAPAFVNNGESAVPGGMKFNEATSWGGGIYNAGDVFLTATELSSNTANYGGAIYTDNNGAINPTLTVNQSTFFSNEAHEDGGAVSLSSGGTFNATTFYENSANRGGAIRNFAGEETLLTNVTVTENFATETGGGIYAFNPLRVRNSIVSGNSGGGIKDISGRVTSLGYNLAGFATSIADFPMAHEGGTNIRDATPELSDHLSRYGGVNHTIVPTSTSPAVGAGAPDGITDQRGYAPEGANDIGAVQFIENFTITNFEDDWQTWRLSRLGNPSLRDAVVILNEQGGSAPKTINLEEGTYRLQVDAPWGGDEFGSLEIQTNMTIVGQGEGSVIDGSEVNDRVFEVVESGNLSLESLTVTGGHARVPSFSESLPGEGGGVRNSGTLSLNKVVITKNQAEKHGGGIANTPTGTTTIVNSIIDDNLAWLGGGILSRGTLVVDSSTISNNNAVGESGTTGTRRAGGGGGAAGLGGGIFVSGGSATLTKSTVSNNSAKGGDGGNVSNGGSLLSSASLFTTATLQTGGTGGGFEGGAGGVLYAQTENAFGQFEFYRTRPGQDAYRFATGGGGGSGVPIRTGQWLAVHDEQDDTSGGAGRSGGGGGGAGATGGLDCPTFNLNCITNPWAGGGGGTRPGGASGGLLSGAGGYGTPTTGGGGGGGAAAGGGIYVSVGDFIATSTTITENSVYGGKGGTGLAGAIANPGEDAVGQGGGIYVRPALATATVQNTIVAGNTAAEMSLYNIVGEITLQGTNVVDGSPGLAPLADNGGFGMTHVPTPESPALDSGSSPFPIDQRQRVNGVGHQDDVGAVESHELIVSSFTDVSNERTLRQALIDAALLPGHDVIELLPGTYTLDAPLVIDSDVTIIGAGADSTIIDGSSVMEDLIVVDGSELSIEGVTIEGPQTGRVLDLKSGHTDIVQAELIGGHDGVPAGWPTRDGGLILVSSNAVLNITESTLHSGQAQRRGGAIAVRGTSVTTIESSTIHGSTAGEGGDAISMAGSAELVLSQSTIASGVENYTGVAVRIGSNNEVELHNSIIEGRLSGAVQSLGYNVIGDASDADGLIASDIVDTDPMLSELADHGGRTKTVRPLAGSPAIDAAENTGTSTDQRGSVRMLGGGMDIGAIERAELFVNRTADDLEAGSLRRAIIDANQLPWAAKIEVEAGTYTLSITGNDSTGLAGDLDILGDITVSGAGVGKTIIDLSGFGDRAFDVMDDASLGLSNLTLTGGDAINGGAIRNAGSLALTTTEVRNSEARNGGAIANLVGGELTILSSLLQGNSADSLGGAIDNRGEAIVRHTTFSGNSADVGGAFYNRANSYAFLTNTTIAENSANVTGGVSSQPDGYVELLNTLIVDNPGGDVSGSFIANTSVIGNVGDATGFADSEVSSGNTFGTGSEVIDPKLGPLQDNGGQTRTYRPAEASLLIDAGRDQIEQGIDPNTNQIVETKVVRDQRGFPRDQRNDASAEQSTDIGAVEAQFDFVQTIEDGATVFVQSVGSGLTEIIEDGEATRFANPYRSLIITTVNAQDTTERIEIGTLAGDFEVTVNRFRLESEEREQLEGSVRLKNGIATVEGTAGSDTSTARVAGSQYKLDVDLGGDPIQVLFDRDVVSSILMTSYDGDDELTAISTVEIPVTLIGGDGDDTLRGSVGADSIRGGAGDDVMYGGNGNDTLRGAGGDDSMYGSLGHDDIEDTSGHNYVAAGSGDDIVVTGWGRDTIVSGGGDDYIASAGAADEIRSGGGEDTVLSGSGNDDIDSGSNADDIRSGAGDDKVDSGNGSDIVRAGSGNDTVSTGGGSDTVLGSDGRDSVVGGDGSDILVGGRGSDTLKGNGGGDFLIGGTGTDTLSGSSGEDILIAGSTVLDSTVSALDVILAEWTSSRSYEIRLANLRNGSGSSNRFNGDRFLLANTTVLDDGSTRDSLLGGSDRDWFFARLGTNADRLSGFGDDEELDELF